MLAIKKAASLAEREEADAFIRDYALSRYGYLPPPLPATIFLARDGPLIVGTLGVETRADEEGFPLENIHFVRGPMPFPFIRSRFIELGRWTAVQPEVSGCLMYAAVITAIGGAKSHGLCELKPRVAALLRRNFGVLTRRVEADLHPENVAPEQRGYYLEVPPPSLYMLDLFQMQSVLEGPVTTMRERGKVEWD